MGIWGRLRFARKPICVIGEISVAPKKTKWLASMCFYKCVLLPQHLVAIVQSAGNIQPRDRLKCQAADILHNTFHVSWSAQKKVYPWDIFPRDFLGGQVAKSFFKHFWKAETDSRFARRLGLHCCAGLWQQWTGFSSFTFPFSTLFFQVFATSAIRGIRFLQVRIGAS